MTNSNPKTTVKMSADAGLSMRSSRIVEVKVSHRYEVECYGPDGQLRWRDGFHNLVPYTGLIKYLDAALKTGLAAPAWYVGLVPGPRAGVTYAEADTMGSHAGWTENTSYSEATRPVWTPGAISTGVNPASVSNVASRAVFSITGDFTLAGCFVTDNNVKGGALGTLLGEGNFDVDRAVYIGDQVNVVVIAEMGT